MSFYVTQQTRGQKRQPKIKTETQNQSKIESAQFAENLQSRIDQLQEQLEIQTDAANEAEAKLKTRDKRKSLAGRAIEQLTKAPEVTIKTAACYCCGSEGIREDELVKIDSGHLFCTECINALQDSCVS